MTFWHTIIICNIDRRDEVLSPPPPLSLCSNDLFMFQATLSPSNAFVLLNGFCQWQNSINGRNGPRHDVAVLVTRKDICEGSGSNCGTLGMKNAIARDERFKILNCCNINLTFYKKLCTATTFNLHQ